MTPDVQEVRELLAAKGLSWILVRTFRVRGSRCGRFSEQAMSR